VGGGDPILAWYSGCETDRIRIADGTGPGDNLDAADRWAVIFGDPDAIDRSGPEATAIESASLGPPLTITDPASGDGIALAWRLAP
jgi:hypothetical protein